MGDRSRIQDVIRLVTCRHCGAGPGKTCVSGTQYGGRYPLTMPDSHQVRWRDAIDAGHLPNRLEELYA